MEQAGGVRSRQREERRQRIVKAARKLLAEKKGESFSMLELAKQAGFSPATPYNLFGSKANVLGAVYAEEMSGFHRVLEGFQALPPADRIVRLAAHFCSEFDRRRELYRGMAANIGGLTLEEGLPQILALNASMLDPVAERLEAENVLLAWISSRLLTNHFTRLLESVFLHWASGEWDVERMTLELQCGFGLAAMGCLKAKPAQQMASLLREPAKRLAVLQSQS